MVAGDFTFRGFEPDGPRFSIKDEAELTLAAHVLYSPHHQ